MPDSAGSTLGGGRDAPLDSPAIVDARIALEVRRQGRAADVRDTHAGEVVGLHAKAPQVIGED